MNKKTKIWVWVIVIVLLLLAVWLAVPARKGAQNTAVIKQPVKQPAKSQPPAVALKVQKTDLPAAQTPADFPSDIPIEKGAVITQNYNATVQGGLFQATRVFVSTQPLAASFTLYSNYLKNNGWTLVNSLNTASVKVLAAKKEGGNLQITISQNTITKVNTVDISYSIQQ